VTSDKHVGIILASQAVQWPDMLAAARSVDRLGYDSLWTWDHITSVFGEPAQPVFEGWTTLGAWAIATERCQIGVLVSGAAMRNPGVLAKMAVTVDHASGGRTILGLGAGWFGPEAAAHGIDFGSGFGERIRWLAETADAVRALTDGDEYTRRGAKYSFDGAVHAPRPVHGRLPIMIGGGGPHTIEIAGRHADFWNGFGSVAELAPKLGLLDDAARSAGRDPVDIHRTFVGRAIIRDDAADAERGWAAALAANRTTDMGPPEPWLGPPALVAERIREYLDVGFDGVLMEVFARYDEETLERLIQEVRPLL
jgi:alkanesulfonate monooxygenase SsuD/methylene tetrahydromethanopterin reductase-like flavin-dependent oxidoreductase (luciferase family)